MCPNCKIGRAAIKGFLRGCNKSMEEITGLQQQRDDLLAACENHKKMVIEGYGNISWMTNYKDMDDAIAKCKT
jgi:hypothetical protein